MSPLSRAGAACLLVGPLAGLASVLIERSVSVKAGDLASTFTAYPTAAHIGLAVTALGTVLTAAGLIWFAWTTYRRAPRLAVIGGVLTVLGSFSIMFDDAVHIAGSAVVSGMTPAQATPLIDQLSSGGIVAAGVLSELVGIGVILLAISALRIGVPRWGVGLICVGAIGEAVGFSSDSRNLAAVGFALAFPGYITVVRTAFAGATTEVTMPVAAQRA